MRRLVNCAIATIVLLVTGSCITSNKFLHESYYLDALKTVVKDKEIESFSGIIKVSVVGFEYHGYVITAGHCEPYLDEYLYHSEEYDIALIKACNSKGLKRAKKQPNFGEKVIYFLVRKGGNFPVVGDYLGPSNEEDNLLDGLHRISGHAWRGFSGSVILNIKGELLGFTQSAMFSVVKTPFVQVESASLYIYYVPVNLIDKAINEYEESRPRR